MFGPVHAQQLYPAAVRFLYQNQGFERFDIGGMLYPEEQVVEYAGLVGEVLESYASSRNTKAARRTLQYRGSGK